MRKMLHIVRKMLHIVRKMLHIVRKMLHIMRKARFDSNMELLNFEKTSLENIKVMLLTIGFHRSGSSLLGFLLTAHPEMVVADEPTINMEKVSCMTLSYIDKVKRPEAQILYEANVQEMIDYIISVDYLRRQYSMVAEQQARRPSSFFSASRSKIYISVPNQYQGRFKQLKVVGVKGSAKNVRNLLKNELLENLKRKFEKSKIALKFIFTVRNPYDIVATIKRINSHRDGCSIVENLCEFNMRILKQIDTGDVFISRHEDMVKDPGLQLTKLSAFLQVPIPTGYLEDCASQVAGEYYRSRFEYDWSKDEKQRVASLIKKYDFFSGYDWDS